MVSQKQVTAPDFFVLHSQQGNQQSKEWHPTPVVYTDLPKVASPADSGIAPSNGDDVSFPNTVKAGKLNAIACHVVANAGYSKSGEDLDVKPSLVDHKIGVVMGLTGEASLTLTTTLEYVNARYINNESMVVHAKMLKQFVSEEALPSQELVLLDTRFQDWVEGDAISPGGKWIDINTDIRYTAQAEAVTQAVIQTDSGQTAGRVKTTGEVLDAKLGPIGQKGRIILTYQAQSLYSYSEMSLE